MYVCAGNDLQPIGVIWLFALACDSVVVAAANFRFRFAFSVQLLWSTFSSEFICFCICYTSRHSVFSIELHSTASNQRTSETIADTRFVAFLRLANVFFSSKITLSAREFYVFKTRKILKWFIIALPFLQDNEKNICISNIETRDKSIPVEFVRFHSEMVWCGNKLCI